MPTTTVNRTNHRPRPNRFLSLDGGFESPVSQQLFMVNDRGYGREFQFREISLAVQRLPNV